MMTAPSYGQQMIHGIMPPQGVMQQQQPQPPPTQQQQQQQQDDLGLKLKRSFSTLDNNLKVKRK